MEIDQQNAILRELELPIACLVYSGKKSLHAIVRVDAADYGEYRKRVDYLYEVCQKNGIDVDTQNRILCYDIQELGENFETGGPVGDAGRILKPGDLQPAARQTHPCLHR